MNEKRKALLSCALKPDNENEDLVNVEIRMEGTLNDMLNAFEHITAHLLKKLAEDFGAEVAKALYAKVQVDALKAAGVGFEEDAEAIKKRAAFMSIFGKTFHVGGDE